MVLYSYWIKLGHVHSMLYMQAVVCFILLFLMFPGDQLLQQKTRAQIINLS